MNNRNAGKVLVWAASVVAAFVAGLLLPHTSSNSESSDPENGQAKRSKRSGPGSTSATRGTPAPRRDEDAIAALTVVQGLLAEGTTSELAQTIRSLSKSWSEDEPSAALQLCLEAWGQRDGGAALEAFGSEHEDSPFATWGLNHLLTGWARSAPADALAWASASTRPFAGKEAALLLNTLRIAAQRGEDVAALSAAGNLPSGSPRQAAANAIASGIMRSRNFEQATQWFGTSAANSPFAGSLVRPFTKRLFNLDRPQSAAWASGLPDAMQRFEAVSQVAQLWSQVEPAAAAVWAQELPAGAPRSQALGEVARNWAPVDAEAAGEWLGSLPAGKEVDRAVSHYVNDIAPTNPEVAARWVDLINDPLAHRAAVLRVSSHWQRTDAAAAARWRGEQSTRKRSP